MTKHPRESGAALWEFGIVSAELLSPELSTPPKEPHPKSL